MSYTTYVELPRNSDADKVLSAHATPAVNTKDYEMFVEVNIASCTEVYEDAERSFAPCQQTL